MQQSSISTGTNIDKNPAWQALALTTELYLTVEQVAERAGVSTQTAQGMLDRLEMQERVTKVQLSEDSMVRYRILGANCDDSHATPNSTTPTGSRR